ncbi:GAF domain-containing protein [Paraflavitalea soli]|uniref:GAF domain-containing protein n=1 Tax=Paraflavitalea soli TaxID=2315862 RepID=A0A3B7MKF5_9BACT|nr:two-component regulator propeller domain-containing protein [Paraflavitalea soli]AXY74658.1 GAF domain-containing protein [Paraflavitalea soli]
MYSFTHNNTPRRVGVPALVFFFALYANGVLAQNSDYLFKHITTTNGLVSNQVSAVIQDSKGYMWFGTQTGLQRYDGKRFITYLSDVRDPNAMQSDWISTIFEDSKHRLWIGSSIAGPCVLNRSTGIVYNFNLHLPAGGKKINGVWQFLEDMQGRIWLSAHDGYYRFDEGSQQFQSMNTWLNMAPNAAPSTISLDKKGNLWFATTKGIKQLIVHTNTLIDADHNAEQLPIFNSKDAVSHITFDDSNNIWISTGYDHYIYRYSAAGYKIKTYSFTRVGQDHRKGLPRQKEFLGGLFRCSNGLLLLPLLSRGLAIYDPVADSFTVINASNQTSGHLHVQPNAFGSIVLTEDKEKNIWIATDAGVNVFNLQKPPFITYGLNNPSALVPQSEVSDFLQTSNGDIYCSNYYVNGGITQFDQYMHVKRHFLWKGKSDYNADANQLWGIFQDKEGIIWAPNQAGHILQLNTKNNKVTILKDSLLFGSINQIKQDAENNIWLAHNRKGLIKIDGSTRKISLFDGFYKVEPGSKRRVMCLLFDKEKIWVGTLHHGLQLFDKKSEKFTEAYMLDEKNRQSISDNNIIGLLEYNQDTLIIATNGGINFFDKKKKTFSALLSKDGLPNNLVQSIILDDNRDLWAAFAGGLSKINMQTLSITNYDANDGIVNDRFNHSFFKLKDGRLMIGAEKGFLVFDPAKITAAKAPVDVTITGFKVFGENVFVDSLINTNHPVSLSYLQNSFHIELASLQFNASNRIKYYYQLEGIDKNWVPVDESHTVHYNQLPSGNFRFKVKCANPDGLFSKNVTTLNIRIIPPFWKTWWFIWIVASVVIIGLFVIIKWREKNIKTLEAGKTQLQKLTAENYKAQFESEQISSFFTTSLLNKTEVDDILWDVAKNLIGKLGFVDCMIYLWNDDKTRMIQKAGYGPKGSLEELVKNHFDVLPGQGVVGAVIQSGEAILIPDTSIDQRYRVDDMKRFSELCVPIKYNEQIIGIIDSEHYEKNFFTRQHLQVLTTIATLVASKIRSIQADQRLRSQREQLAHVNDRLAEVQLAALRGQMNPHFIFNALNSIKKFIIANEPANAEKYLGKFSKLIRSILDNSRSGMVTIDKELQLLVLYLDLEQLRFGTKLTYNITVDKNIRAADIQIPSMIIQPFVENAMLHGIMHREDGGMVDIHFVLHGEWLEITIEDNGVGRAKSASYKSSNSEPHHSIGIEVATKRLEALKRNENTPAGISIIDLVDEAAEAKGTKVVIEIPIY